MFYIDKLKEQIAKATKTLADALAYIDSPEYAAICKERYGDDNISLASLGYLQGGIQFTATPELNHAAWLVEQSMPKIAEMERCSALCEVLDLDDEDIRLLTAMASSPDHRYEREHLKDAISKAVTEARYEDREREYRDACKALEAAGFEPSADDDDILDRITPGTGASQERSGKTERITIETKRKHSDFWWEFLLEVNGREAMRGKSGEFANLLAAVGIEEEVKAK